MNYTNYGSNRYNRYTKDGFSPKAVVKNFTDLEVYQKALETSVFVGNELVNFLKASKSAKTKKQENTKIQVQGSIKTGEIGAAEDNYQLLVENSLMKNLLQCAMSIPHLIAESHSKRFGQSTECLKILDEVMLRCNKMVVYLEQARDILRSGIETERFQEQIDKYFYIRRKVLNLQRVWRKYIEQNSENNKT